MLHRVANKQINASSTAEFFKVCLSVALCPVWLPASLSFHLSPCFIFSQECFGSTLYSWSSVGLLSLFSWMLLDFVTWRLVSVEIFCVSLSFCRPFGVRLNHILESKVDVLLWHWSSVSGFPWGFGSHWQFYPSYSAAREKVIRSLVILKGLCGPQRFPVLLLIYFLQHHPSFGQPLAWLSHSVLPAVKEMSHAQEIFHRPCRK